MELSSLWNSLEELAKKDPTKEAIKHYRHILDRSQMAEKYKSFECHLENNKSILYLNILLSEKVKCPNWSLSNITIDIVVDETRPMPYSFETETDSNESRKKVLDIFVHPSISHHMSSDFGFEKRFMSLIKQTVHEAIPEILEDKYSGNYIWNNNEILENMCFKNLLEHTDPDSINDNIDSNIPIKSDKLIVEAESSDFYKVHQDENVFKNDVDGLCLEHDGPTVSFFVNHRKEILDLPIEFVGISPVAHFSRRKNILEVIFDKNKKFKNYHAALYSFLQSNLSIDKEQISVSRQSAQEKLSKLTSSQFHELATDVFDELDRRESKAANMPFLPLKDEFHQKRNQARQKLATLSEIKFRDLASDVYYEIENRFPEVCTNQPEVTTQDETLESLDNLMNDLGHMLKNESKKENVSGMLDIEDSLMTINREIGSLKKQMEVQKGFEENVNEADEKIRQLEILKEKQEDINRRLFEENEELRKSIAQLSHQYANLIKRLDLMGQNNKEKITHHDAQPTQRKIEANDVQNTASVHENSESKSFNFDGSLFQNFLNAMDQMQTAASSRLAADILDSMKTIVNIARKISESAEEFELYATLENINLNKDDLKSLRATMSSKLSSLITVAKQCATGREEPNLDKMINDASNSLTDTVVELIDFIKSKKSKSRIQKNSDENIKVGDILKVKKVALEKETNDLVQNIQDLLVTLKEAKSNIKDLESSAKIISNNVSILVSVEDNAYSELSQWKNELIKANEKLQRYFNRNFSEYIGEKGCQDKLTKQRVAAVAYEVAKSAKDLLSLMEKDGSNLK
ncbi:hypothetical protein O9G_004166 [Rozella allomycis CSF55]|uniref:GIT Spa2 homology (SHD) domain-containing protein n=1 Tax=Rozella allomycis (strain CSF55) TaxID=988480 RepID=A0A075ATC5_ROZAC|nr:hypothetical protein O9G_004166 [Rozella allomycis CSF55]|eukprot:EPZ31975.1 hypothetical protein O9G_004166 [Rozella allomycis CSF55]